MEKFFCISMQRTGTTSVGTFFEKNGCKRVGWPQQNKLGWSKLWYDGNIEPIFASPEFQQGVIFDDGPWWAPDLYKILYHRFPEARFVHFDRDADGWFKSMLRHSQGTSLGSTRNHVVAYDREDDLRWLIDHVPAFPADAPRWMILYDKSEQYKAAYRRYNEEAKLYFRDKPAERYFHVDLKDPDKWVKLAAWAGPAFTLTKEVHEHKVGKAFNEGALTHNAGILARKVHAIATGAPLPSEDLNQTRPQGAAAKKRKAAQEARAAARAARAAKGGGGAARAAKGGGAAKRRGAGRPQPAGTGE